MQDKLPSSVLRRSKSGLDIPTHDWFRGTLRPLLLDTLSAHAVDKTNLFRRDRIEFLIKQHMDRRANLGYHLWGLLVLFLWIKYWNIQTVSAPRVTEKIAARAFTRA
jgi:asparagine synthase (glutamine-hydrolysing)